MTFPLATTLNRIYASNPCNDLWQRSLAAASKATPDDEPILFSDIARTVGLVDALWCCRTEAQHARLWRLFAVWCARQVQHLMNDQRSITALDTAKRHANGQATDEELAAAKAAAEDAIGDTDGAAAWVAAEAAAGTTDYGAAVIAAAGTTAKAAARNTARAAAIAAATTAACTTAGAAAEAAAWAAACVATACDSATAAATTAAWTTAFAAAEAAARDAQLEAFTQLCDTGELPAVAAVSGAQSDS